METGSLHLKAREEFSSNLLQLLCTAWKSHTKSAVSSVLEHSSVITVSNCLPIKGVHLYLILLV